MPSRKKQPPTATPAEVRLARVDALSFEGLVSESGTAGMWKSLISELPANDVDKVPESAPLAELEIPVKHLLERLSFTHFIELMKCGDPLERVFYEVECIRGNWSVRELKRQIATQYFERSGQWRSWEAEMSEREKHAGWVYPEAHESPKGVTQRSDASAHGDVGLRPSVVSVLNHEAANPIYEIEVCEQFGGSAELENAIKTNLKGLGYGE